VPKVIKHINYRLTTPAFSAQGRGNAELVEKVVMSNAMDSTISQKVEVLPEA
jgi:hypothetical protein